MQPDVMVLWFDTAPKTRTTFSNVVHTASFANRQLQLGTQKGFLSLALWWLLAPGYCQCLNHTIFKAPWDLSQLVPFCLLPVLNIPVPIPSCKGGLLGHRVLITVLEMMLPLTQQKTIQCCLTITEHFKEDHCNCNSQVQLSAWKSHADTKGYIEATGETVN